MAGERKTEKISERNREGFLVIPVEIMTETIYGMPINSLPLTVREFLTKKYGEEIMKHIDTAFPRAKHPITNTTVPYIPGRAVYTAMKEASGLKLKPMTMPNVSVLGIYLSEDAMTVQTYHITLPDKTALFTAEVANPNYNGSLIIMGDPSKFPRELMTDYIRIGRGRKKGMGLIRVNWRAINQ